MWTVLKHVDIMCTDSEHVENFVHVEITRSVTLNIKTLHFVTRYVYRYYSGFTTDAACLVCLRKRN